MNKLFSPEHPPFRPRGFLLSLCLATGLGLVHTLISSAQTLDPIPAPISTPVIDPTSSPTPLPSATPTDTPVPIASPVPAGTPQITITPGLPAASVIAAYNALRTPLVDVTLNVAATVSSTASSASAVGSTAPAASRQQVQGGVCTQVTLPSPATAKSKIANTTSTTTGATSQPVATVVLTYDMSWTGRMVWVQMLGRGTLTADDGAGHTYDGSKGFFITLDVNAMATFNYQTPNVGGTYQVLTRLQNVATVLPFLVPDPAP